MPAPSVQSLASWAIYLVIAAAICGVCLLAIHAFGIVVPPFVMTAIWILLIAFVLVMVISALARMAGPSVP